MPNLSNMNITEVQRRFIEEIAELFVPWGVPQTAARLYGYLLLCPEAASLDSIAVDLEISKSSASVAARLLERYTLVRRRSVRGSKRILYEVSDQYDEILAGQNRMLLSLSDLLRGAEEIVPAAATRQRLEDMADFYDTARRAMDEARRKWSKSKKIR